MSKHFGFRDTGNTPQNIMPQPCLKFIKRVFWLQRYYENNGESALMIKFIKDKTNMPVMVTMICGLRKKKYEDILKLIIVDHF